MDMSGSTLSRREGTIAAEQHYDWLLSVFKHAAEAMLVSDTRGYIVYVNPAFETLTGYTQEEATNNHTRMLKSGRHSPEFYKSLWKTISQGKDWKGIVYNRHKDGSVITSAASISPIINKRGQITHYLEILRDLTELNSLEEQLRQSQKMDTLGNLASGIAHDMKNVLAGIQAFSHLALELNKANCPREEIDAKLNAILGAVDRGRKIASQILDFSHSTPFRHREEVCLQAIAQESIDMFRSSVKSGISLEVNLPKEPAYTMADPTEIQQVLLNLLTNACDAITCEEGIVRLSLELPKDRMSPSLGQQGFWHRIAVSDNGCGMDAETQARIFQPFFTTKRKGKGTGLGLSIIQRIVQDHKGEVILESVPGEGTKVEILLPSMRHILSQTPELTQAILRDDPKKQNPNSGPHVLYVDDDSYLVEAGMETLLMMGFQVSAFKNAEDALRAFAQEPESFDAVLTDMTMPNMNGRQFAQLIRELHREIPIYLLSADAHELDLEETDHDLFDEIMRKPISFKDVGSRLSHLLMPGNKA